MNANQLLDRHYLEVRARLLEIAATLDRIDRAQTSSASSPVTSDASAQPIDADPRMTQLKQGIELLLSEGDDRAAKVQQLFSLTYDPNWRSKYQL